MAITITLYDFAGDLWRGELPRWLACLDDPRDPHPRQAAASTRARAVHRVIRLTYGVTYRHARRIARRCRIRTAPRRSA